jgi:ATP-dependent RNA helicase DDX41
MVAVVAIVSNDDDNYKEYIPVAERRAMETKDLRQRRLSKQASSSLPLPPPPSLPPAQSFGPNVASAKPSHIVKATQLKCDAPEVTATKGCIMHKEMIENLWEKKSLMSVYNIMKYLSFEASLQI